MTTMFKENVAHGPYTVSPSIAASRIEVVSMADLPATVFVVDDDISVRESLELLIKHAGWQPDTFASAGISCPALLSPAVSCSTWRSRDSSRTRSRRPMSEAHNRQLTPLFAKSIERHAMLRK